MIKNYLTDFLSHTSIPNVHFKHNDYVRVVQGQHVEKTGSLVSLIEMQPEPVFILESEQDGDIQIAQSCIELIEADGLERK